MYVCGREVVKFVAARFAASAGQASVGAGAAVVDDVLAWSLERIARRC